MHSIPNYVCLRSTLITWKNISHISFPLTRAVAAHIPSAHHHHHHLHYPIHYLRKNRRRHIHSTSPLDSGDILSSSSSSFPSDPDRNLHESPLLPRILYKKRDPKNASARCKTPPLKTNRSNVARRSLTVHVHTRPLSLLLPLSPPTSAPSSHPTTPSPSSPHTPQAAHPSSSSPPQTPSSPPPTD